MYIWSQESGMERAFYTCKKLDIRFTCSHVYCAFHPRFLVQNIQGYFEPIEGNFIMQVVDIRAFSVMFAVLSIPDSWSRI